MRKKFFSLLLCLIIGLSIAPNHISHASAISATEMKNKFEALKNQYPTGYIWKQGYWFSDYNKNEGYDGAWQCLGFARLVYSTLFNESEWSAYQHRNLDNLCVGDHIRYNSSPKFDHSIIVTNIIGDKVYYVDCNGSNQDGSGWIHCMVRWDKWFTKTQLQNLINKELVFNRGKYGYVATQKDNWVKTLNPVTSPSAPSSINLSSRNLPRGGSITASWNSVAGATSYDVTLNCTSNSSYNQKTSVTGTSATFVLNNEATYTISVSAKNSAGNSAASTSTSFEVHKDVTVTFKNYDGTLLTTQTIRYGATAVSPPAPSREGYTFQGWDKSLNNITADTIITATYLINTYTVKFVDNEGNTIDTQRITYGDTAIEPSEPTPPSGYIFVGWDTEDYKCVKTDLVVNAVFAWENFDLPIIASIESAARNTDASGYDLAISLQNYPNGLTRGKVIATLKTEAGKMVASETQTFNISENEIINESLFIPYSGVATFAEISVVGVIDDGNTGVPISVTSTKEIDLGLEWSNWSEDTPPTGDYITESRTEYRYKNKHTTTSSSNTMSGWTRYDSQITSWGNWSGWQNTAITSSSTRQVETRDIAATYQTRWTYDRYINSAGNFSSPFSGDIYQKIDLDYQLSCYGDYQGCGNRYGNYIYGGNTYLQKMWWHESSYQKQLTAAYKQYRYRDAVYTHYFYKWDDWSDWQTTQAEATDTCQVESRTVYRFKSNDVKIPSYNYKRYKYQNLNNGNYYYTYISTYADSMGYPGEWEYKKSYSELEKITTVENEIDLYGGYGENSWYKADINESGIINTYIIYDTLEDTSGNEYTISGTVNAANKKATLMVYKGTNTDPTASQLEYVEQTTLGDNGEYSFAFNPKEIPSIKTGDFIAVIGVEGATAPIYIDTIYAPKPTYTVEFVDEDGNTIDTQTVMEGDSATLPDTIPQKEGHDFIGWDTGITNVHADLIIKAQFKKKTFNVVFVDWENNDIAIKIFEYGDSLEGPTPTEKEGSSFKGWDKILNGVFTVTENMIVTAEYEPNKYTISFADWNGDIIDTQILEYGEEAVMPEEPTMENMIFSGWSDAQLLIFACEDITVYPIFEYEETASIPTADITSGTYSETQLVSLKCNTPQSDIYYSIITNPEHDIVTDNILNTVDFEWIKYVEPIEITENSILIFYSSAENMNNSAYQTETYNIIGKFSTEITGSSLKIENNNLNGKIYYNIVGEGASADAILILTVQDSNGKLVHMITGQNSTWTAGDNTGTANISIPIVSDRQYQIKLLLWQSMDNLIPIAESESFYYN